MNHLHWITGACVGIVRNDDVERAQGAERHSRTRGGKGVLARIGCGKRVRAAEKERRQGIRGGEDDVSHVARVHRTVVVDGRYRQPDRGADGRGGGRGGDEEVVDVRGADAVQSQRQIGRQPSTDSTSGDSGHRRVLPCIQGCKGEQVAAGGIHAKLVGGRRRGARADKGAGGAGRPQVIGYAALAGVPPGRWDGELQRGVAVIRDRDGEVAIGDVQ